MEVIAFIPARGGSKSIKGKNIKDLAGKPLICWVLEELTKSKEVSKIVVATEDPAIAEVSESLQIPHLEIFWRSEENAKDTSSTEDVMLEYIEEKNLDENSSFVLTQATSPFTLHTHFNEALDMHNSGEFDSILSCARLKRFFWEKSGAPINYDYRNRPRRQDFDGILIENGAFYINTVRNILKDKNRLSGKIGLYEMPEHTSHELDEPHDWEIAERLIARYHPTPKTKEIKMLLSDVDGVLTDAGMYYSEHGDELKKFNTYDGMAFAILKKNGIITGIVTSEKRSLNDRRAKKLQLDHIHQGVKDKLTLVKEICSKEGIDISEIAYIGDDINDKEVLSHVGIAACPANAMSEIKAIPGIIQLRTKGGEGALRELIGLLNIR
ncbi:MAG: HAD hydrolase-like protein [Bacteroidota bacterium]